MPRLLGKINLSMANSVKRNTQYTLLVYCVFLLLSACTPAATPTYFIPPTAPGAHPLVTVTGKANIATPTPGLVNPNETPPPQEEVPTAEPELPSPTPPCTNVLTFLEDVTVTDGTVLAAGEAFVKQWRVKNDGTCDWTSAYTLKLISGDPMGSPEASALFPAAAGAEALIEMSLVTPVEPGLYHTVWQAYDSDGNPFEQAIYVDIVVE